MVFGRGVESQSKIDPKTMSHEAARTTPQIIPKSARHGPQNRHKMGPCWPSKLFWTRPRADKRPTENDIEKDHRLKFGTKKRLDTHFKIDTNKV